MSEYNSIFITGLIFCILGIVLTIFSKDLITTVIGTTVMFIGFLLMILERWNKKEEVKDEENISS